MKKTPLVLPIVWTANAVCFVAITIFNLLRLQMSAHWSAVVEVVLQSLSGVLSTVAAISYWVKYTKDRKTEDKE